MNLPGWNEQPDSDQLSDQNRQLRDHYLTLLSSLVLGIHFNIFIFKPNL